MRDVFVRLSYIEDLKAGLPISYLEFWFAKQSAIDDAARAAFDDPRPSSVDPAFDIVEVRGHWVAGNCDYFVDARLTAEDTVELISIDFDLDPIRLDP